ncbi:hypothetical protein [Thermogemmatispora sp.]|jgi:hypothetical protein|uniref:hypothetical protein n=1 Tax=Thermogemmatispora sp. TaxID=1968838 RepID=UPI0025798AE6|nr:hypothetical protein [Thermogemmatispora sp.]
MDQLHSPPDGRSEIYGHMTGRRLRRGTGGLELFAQGSPLLGSAQGSLQSASAPDDLSPFVLTFFLTETTVVVFAPLLFGISYSLSTGLTLSSR